MAAKLARDEAKTQEQQVEIPGTGVALPLSSLSAHVASELAAGLSDSEAVRQRYGISDPQWEVLRKSPAFRSMLTDYLQKFRGDLNTRNRIQLKATICLEDSILEIYKLVNDQDIPAAARIEAAKFLASITGVTKEQASGPAGNGFSISINFNGGNEAKTVTLDGRSLPATG